MTKVITSSRVADDSGGVGRPSNEPGLACTWARYAEKNGSNPRQNWIANQAFATTHNSRTTKMSTSRAANRDPALASISPCGRGAGTGSGRPGGQPGGHPGGGPGAGARP